VWTSPTGRSYRTTPLGAELLPELAATPRRRTRAQQRAAYIARERNRNHVQRPINDAQRELDRAREPKNSRPTGSHHHDRSSPTRPPF
jgi:hypothetical protein